MKSLSGVRLLTTPWTAAYQAPPSMGFSTQEYWSGVPLPSLGAMLSKSLIQFSVVGWGCVHSLLFDLRPNYGGVMKIKATSFKRSHACTATLSAPNPAAGHCRPMPLLETLRHSQASLDQSLVGSLFLFPGSWFAQASVCALQESVSQSCVSSDSSMVGLMVTSSKRAYAIPKSIAPRAPTPAAVHY